MKIKKKKKNPTLIEKIEMTFYYAMTKGSSHLIAIELLLLLLHCYYYYYYYHHYYYYI